MHLLKLLCEIGVCLYFHLRLLTLVCHKMYRNEDGGSGDGH